MNKPEYYVWHDEGDCDNKTNNLQEAIRWRDEFRAEGRDSYITNDDNEVIDVGDVYMQKPAEGPHNQ